MPIGGKEAFLSKVTFRRESDWVSKTKQMLNDMKSIEERAWEKYPEVIKHHNLAHIDINEEKRRMYIEIATEQQAIDIEIAVAYLRKYVRPYYKFSIEDFKKAMEESAMTDEEYLNSKIEAYGKAHPNGNKEDLELLAEMRGYDKEGEL